MVFVYNWWLPRTGVTKQKWSPLRHHIGASVDCAYLLVQSSSFIGGIKTSTLTKSSWCRSLRQLLEDLIWWSPRVTWLMLDMFFSWLQKGGALQPHALLHLWCAWDIQCSPCFPLTNFRAITVPHGSTRYIKYLYHPAQPYASRQMWAMLIGSLTMGHVNSVWCWRLAWKVGRWTL